MTYAVYTPDGRIRRTVECSPATLPGMLRPGESVQPCGPHVRSSTHRVDASGTIVPRRDMVERRVANRVVVDPTVLARRDALKARLDDPAVVRRLLERLIDRGALDEVGG